MLRSDCNARGCRVGEAELAAHADPGGLLPLPSLAHPEGRAPALPALPGVPTAAAAVHAQLGARDPVAPPVLLIPGDAAGIGDIPYV
eukprot:364318-Chlamydomonas_euryale.AAC.11